MLGNGRVPSLSSLLRAARSFSWPVLVGPWKAHDSEKRKSRSRFNPHPHFIDLLMGLFRGAVFRHGGRDRKQPIEQPTEMPTSNMALMGRFPSLMGRFPTLMLGKRKHTPPCSSAELFFAEKNGGHRGKISVVDMVFLVCIGFLYPPPAWKVFL